MGQEGTGALRHQGGGDQGLGSGDLAELARVRPELILQAHSLRVLGTLIISP